MATLLSELLRNTLTKILSHVTNIICTSLSTHQFLSRINTRTLCPTAPTTSREHALWALQQWFCVLFYDESRFSLQSDSHRSLTRRAPGTRYQQENTTERHRLGGAGLLVWGGGIILGSRTDLHFQIGTMTGQIYPNINLEQHVRLFRGAMGAEFVFMDDNTRPPRCKHSKRMSSIGGYHPYGLVSILIGLESSRACVGYACRTMHPVNHLLHAYRSFGRASE
ncbi:nibrin [Trichonephila clavipes]|nr:nibrin [Trichonephila clavipes]